jgi:putative hydrolase of the HAD superfamily
MAGPFLFAYRRPVRALIFDLDNTLFDHAAAMRRFLGRAMALPDDAVQRLIAFDAAGTADRLEFCSRVADEIASSLSPQQVWERLRVGLAEHARLRRGVPGMIRDAGARWELAMLTNGGSATQRAKIQALGLDALFEPDRIVISAEIGWAKPRPEAFEEALQRVGADPSDAVYVGDDPNADMAGAAAVGMSTCWVARGRSFPDTAGPDYTIQHVLELSAIWDAFRT